MAYSAIDIEGGLFPADLIDAVADGKGPGQQAKDFGVSGRLSDEMQAAFADIRLYAEAFESRRKRSSESLTSLTRDYLVRPLLERLGYDQLEFQRAAQQVGDASYLISHLAGEVPVHIVGYDDPLDKRAGAKRSPHALVQEYLNRTDALWGLVTNGRRIRLLRNSVRFSRPTYLEFDLAAMAAGNLYSEFTLLYRLIHRTRLPDGDPARCLLETLYGRGIEQGSRVREGLRKNVEQAIVTFGQAAVRAAPEQRVAEWQNAPSRFYAQLLRLIYRLLFLMVAEERKLIGPDDAPAEKQAIYWRYYSIDALRWRAEQRTALVAGVRPPADLWRGLVATFGIWRDGSQAAALGLAPLGGELFGQDACRDLDDLDLPNDAVLNAIFDLSTFVDGGQRRRVNYAALDVEELGSIYESLLDYHPNVLANDFDLIWGSERKTTGSYYTPKVLVAELMTSAVDPVIADRLAGVKGVQAQEAALLDLRVVDPAAGSGHFLLAAARRIATALARVRTGEDEPPPEQFRHALRDVIRTCIHGVDKNPLAVDLCKAALWIESHDPGKPLSFLDHHIKTGDSLVGVFDPAVCDPTSDRFGIPDGAYLPVIGDDKKAAVGHKQRNAKERDRQASLDTLVDTPLPIRSIADDLEAFADLEENTPADVQAKRGLHDSVTAGQAYQDVETIFNLWTAAFYLPLLPEDPHHPSIVTTAVVRRAASRRNVNQGDLVGKSAAVAMSVPFFHWPLAFPDVMVKRGGFDLVLGNPPWEKVEMDEREFFASRDPDIANAPTSDARKRKIAALPMTNPNLYAQFATQKFEFAASTRFYKGSDRFPLSGKGRINTYSVFAELDRALVRPGGRAGFIAPTGLATDDTTKDLFGAITGEGQLASLYDFENRNGIFPAVDSRQKFSLITLRGDGGAAAEYAFFLHDAAEIRDPARRLTLSAADLALLNPNTRTTPIFRTSRDAAITRAIYQRVPVLLREGGANPWGVSFAQGLYNMSTDSGLFRTADQLRADGWRHSGNTFRRGGDEYLPLYEAKMIHHYDHRFGDYADRPAGSESTALPDIPLGRLADPTYRVQPRYWVPAEDVADRLKGRWDREWLLGWRDICRSTDERTVIASVVPAVGIGDTFLLMLPSEASYHEMACALGNLCSFVLDFVARQKIGGTHLKYHVFKQLAMLPPDTYRRPCPWSPTERLADWIACRVLELVYTADDLAAFARDLGHDGPPFRYDPARRFTLRCELDAAFFHLYGIDRDDAAYILDTFPIVRRHDEAAWGEYRTKRVILEEYETYCQQMLTYGTTSGTI